MAGLTELDFCVLGVIWRAGPVTAYRVRTTFRDSTTAAWSSSAGTVYPSIERLARAGLVSQTRSSDRRGTRQLTITPDGRRRLRDWLVVIPSEVGTATPDPIRTRSQFLTSVSAPDRVAFVETARAHTQAAVDHLKSVGGTPFGKPEDVLDRLGTLGAIMELDARLAWLDKVLELLPDR